MKKAFNIVKTVLLIMIVIFAVVMMIFTLVSVNTFDKNDRNLFGYKFFVVKTDSMAKTDFDAGDVILTKELNPSKLQVGDVITFVSQNDDSYGEIITHKILEIVIEPDADGNQVIEAEVPQAEMSSYAIDLRAMTQARGSFSMKFERYEEVPKVNQQKIIDEAKEED